MTELLSYQTHRSNRFQEGEGGLDQSRDLRCLMLVLFPGEWGKELCAFSWIGKLARPNMDTQYIM